MPFTTRENKLMFKTATAKDRCWCFKTALFCGMFFGRKKGSSCRPPQSMWWRQWWLGLRSRKSGRYQQRRSIEKVADLMKPPIETVGGVFESDGEEYRDDDDDEEEEEEEEDELENEEEEETRVFISSTPLPSPKNALLLMRCRSAPHNWSSSLATNRFPVSSPPPSESEFYSVKKKREDEEKKEEKGEEEGRKSSNGSSGEDGEEAGEKEGSRPLVLMQCKSVPVRLCGGPGSGEN